MYIFVHGALEMSEKCSCVPGTDVSLSGEDKFLSASFLPVTVRGEYRFVWKGWVKTVICFSLLVMFHIMQQFPFHVESMRDLHLNRSLAHLAEDVS